MRSKPNSKTLSNRWLDVDEVRLIADLRIMHAKVEELSQVVNALKRHHHEDDIYHYADQPVLTEDIQRVDEIYGWFVTLKELQRGRRA